MSSSGVTLQSLAQVLASTFSEHAAIRQQAEEQLKAFETVEGGHGMLLQLIALPADAVPFEVKQSASLRLKNIYSEYSSIRAGALNKISALDRQLVRDSILEAVIRQDDSRLRIQLLQVVYYVWPSDNPSEWNTLVPNIVANLQAGMSASPPDMLRIYGCVCTLRMVLKKYQFRDPKARQPVYTIVDQTFPLLLPILQTMAGLGANATDETREICRILCKIFFLSTTLSLPPTLLADFNKCVPWFDVLLFLLEVPVPGLESIQGGDPISNAEKLRITPGWRCKKWVAQIFLRLYNRWGRPKMVGEGKNQTKEQKAQLKAWATQFENQYTTKILGIIMNILKVKSEGGYVTDRIIHQSLTYISTSIDSSVHYKMLKPYLPFLIQDVILKSLQLTPGDLQLWKQDPHEFIRRSLDLLVEFQDPRMAAVGLLNDLLKFRTRDTLELTITTIQRVFETYESTDASQRNYVLKEGAMRMFGSIKKLIMSDKRFRAGIEDMLKRHVVPEFQNPHPFLRARACWVIGKYQKLVWADEAAHATAVRACVDRLQDPELPVKMESWTAASRIIEHEKVFEFLQPMLPTIISAFHTLFDEIGNEAVVGVMQTLVETFGEKMIPYAIQLLGKLTHLYLELQQTIAASGDDYDEDADEAASTAYHCLQTIVAILYAIQSKPEMYAQVLAPCCAILDVSINDCSVEVYETILDMASVLVYQPENGPIPDCMWKYLPMITGSFFTWAGDFLDHMLPVFDTFLSKGSKMLITPQGQPLLEAIFNVAKFILSDQERLIDSASACVLVESILANLRGQVDVLIGPIVTMSGTRLLTIIRMEEERAAAKKRKAEALAKKKKSKGLIKKGKGGKAFVSKEADVEEEEDEEESEELAALKMGLLDSIGIACHYNPILFSQVIQSQPLEFSQPLFNIWLSYVKAMKNDFDVAKNAVLGLSSLLLIPIQSLPDAWRSGLPNVCNILLAILSEMSKLLEEEPEDEEKTGDDEDAVHFQDIPEDKDVYTGDDPQDASDEDIDEAAADGDDDAPIDFLDDMEEAMLGSQGADKFVSPLDDIDPFVFFSQAIQTFSQQESTFFQQWTQSIGAAGQQVLQAHIDQAKRHAEEMEQEKKEEAEKKAAAQK